MINDMGSERIQRPRILFAIYIIVRICICLIYIYIYTPRTQMTLVLLGKGLVLGGWPSKTEVSWVLGIYWKHTHVIFTDPDSALTGEKFLFRTPTFYVPFSDRPRAGRRVEFSPSGFKKNRAVGAEAGVDACWVYKKVYVSKRLQTTF